jgi:GntR family transcriptional regulator
VGMFVRDGARRQLLASEREKFLTEEWPRLATRIEQLGLKLEDLINSGKSG